MKTKRQFFLMALLGTVTAVSAQVQIPGEQPGGNGGEPTFGELNGTAIRGTLRQPYTGGLTMPSWMYGEHESHHAPQGFYPPTQPPFVPSYRRVNLQSGEQSEEFFTTMGELGEDPFADPYMEGMEDLAADPFGGMDSALYTDPYMEGMEDPAADPFGGMDPSMNSPIIPPFIPGYQRVNILTGEFSDEFFTTSDFEDPGFFGGEFGK